MRVPPQIAMLPDGRLHLQHGPIDLIVGAFGGPEVVHAAYGAAARRFATVLDELCGELSLLRSPVRVGSARPQGVVARRMYEAVAPFAAETFITPMAAVAGSIAQEVLGAMIETDQPSATGVMLRRAEGPSRSTQAGSVLHEPRASFETAGSAGLLRMTQVGDGQQRSCGALTRVYVNNGGDIALHLAPGERFRIGLVDRPDKPGLFGTTTITAADRIGGIATSGWRGRSFSLGIADAVTVLAGTAAQADAAATIIANAVDLPGHPAVTRVPACALQPDSDLGDRPVTRAVGRLSEHDVGAALDSGVRCAGTLVRHGLIRAAALHCAGQTRTVGLPNSTPEPESRLSEPARHSREVRYAHA